MAQNITIQGASYSDVPAVTLPKTGGGTAQFDDTSDASLDNGNKMLNGVTAYADGTKYTGTIQSKGATTYQASTSDQTIASGVYLSGTQTIKGYSVQSKTITENGTYTPSSGFNGFYTVTVNVPTGGGSSMNCQTAQSTTRATSSSYTDIISLTCEVAGTYDVYWSTFRSSTSGTWGSQLYLNNTAYGSAQTGSWSNHIQNIKLTGVSISADADVAVRVRTRGSNYYGYVGTLTIIQTS